MLDEKHTARAAMERLQLEYGKLVRELRMQKLIAAAKEKSFAAREKELLERISTDALCNLSQPTS